MADPDPRVQIGKLVGAARSRARLSQDSLAARMQEAGLPISSSKLAAIESGKTLPNTESARILERILGIDLRGFELPQPRVHILSQPSNPTLPEGPIPPPTSPAAPPAAEEPSATEVRSPEKVERRRVGEYPRVTLYLAPETKRLLDAASGVLGVPAYRILTAAFLEHLKALPEADQRLIARVAKQRRDREGAKPAGAV